MQKLILSNFVLTLLIIVYLVIQVVHPQFWRHSSQLISSQVAVVEDYIISHPETLIASLEAHHKAQVEMMTKRAQDKIVERSAEIFNNAADPRVGNPQGKIKIVEFFDYSCGYCQKMLAVKRKILESNKDVQFIMKELPILSDASATRARASLAFYKVAPDKYNQYQEALFKLKGSSDVQKACIDLAKSLGVNEEAFKAALAQPAGQDAILESNMRLALDLGLRATPAYIIGNEVIMGYTDYEAFNEKIKTNLAKK